MKQLLAVLIAVGPILCAVPAQAVVLSPGDIVVTAVDRLTHVDPTTGDRTIFSCSNLQWCNQGLVGSGPDIVVGGGIGLDSDGSLIGFGSVPEIALIRIDPETGDREVISGPGVGGGDLFASDADIVVIPPATTSAVSVLPSWGLALILGISIGAWLQTRRFEARLAHD